MIDKKNDKKAEEILSKFIVDTTEELKKISKVVEIFSVKNGFNADYVKVGLDASIKAAQGLLTTAINTNKSIQNIHNFLHTERNKPVEETATKESQNQNKNSWN